MQKRHWILAFTLLLMLGFGLVSLTQVNVQAIGEITPTPAPLNPAAPQEAVDVEQFLTEAFTNIQNEEFQMAVEQTTAVLATEPDNAEAYFIRALAYSNLTQTSLALDDFTRAIELVPETYHNSRAVVFPITEWLLYSLRGDLFVQTGETGEAMFDYDTALRLTPYSDNVLAFRSRAALNRQLGDTVGGEVDEAVAQGLEDLSTGDTSGALEAFTEAIASGQQSPSVAIAYYNRAIIQQNLGNAADSFQDFSDAIRVNPQMHIAYLARGISFREADDIVAAGEDFLNRINILGNETVDERLNIGEVLEINMDYRRVVRIQFDATAGQTVNIAAREALAGTVDPLIALLDPNGTPIAGDDDFGGNLDSEIDSFQLPATGHLYPATQPC